MKAPAAHTAALAGLLGVRLEDVVVRDVDRGLELLASIEGKGRAAIFPLCPSDVALSGEALPEMDGLIGRLAGPLPHENPAPLVPSLVGDAVVVRDVAAMMTVRNHVQNAP